MDVYRGKKVLLESGTLRPACVMVQNGKILQVHESYQIPQDLDETSIRNVVDIGDNYVMMAGLVDTSVHIQDPGRGDWEGFAAVTKAAAAGGITTLIDMPIHSKPPITSTDSLFKKVSAANGKCYVDVGFWGGVCGTSTTNVKNIRSLLKSGVAGFQCYLSEPDGVSEDDKPPVPEKRKAPWLARSNTISSGVPPKSDDGENTDTGPISSFNSREFPRVNLQTIEDALSEMRNSDSVLLIDCRMPNDRTKNEQLLGNQRQYKVFLESHPESLEVEGVQKVLGMLRRSYDNVRVHFTNIASGEAIELIKAAQNDGLEVTAECTHHHLNYTDADIADGFTQLKCLPPIRDEVNQELLWDGIREGVINQVVSSHTPCPFELKRIECKTGRYKNGDGNFSLAMGGISASLQFSLPLMWTASKREGISLFEMNRLISFNPATLAGLEHRKGCILPGFDADFVIWDPNENFTVDAEDILCRNKDTSPYIGKKLKGVVKRTIVRGTTVFNDGKIILQKPPGRKLLSGELGEEVGRFGEVVPGGPQISRRMSLNPAMVTTAFAPGEKDPRLTRRQSYYK